MGLSAAADALTATAPSAGAPDFSTVLQRFQDRLAAELQSWLAAKRREALACGQPEMLELIEGVGSLAAAGGKRLRPALVVQTCRAASRPGSFAEETALSLALATELLHTYLLLHDDIMDHALVRRGRPTAQVRFEELHRERALRGDAAEFGRSVAILLGDLAYAWSVELALGVAARAERGAEIGRCFSAMCQEVIGGQYLEITVAERRGASEDELLRILRQKSGRYTAERPIQLGALLAEAPEAVAAPLRRYGSAIGEAFQLQDDLLGTFGDSAAIGKPVDSDLREGKYTFLIHHALSAAGTEDRARLEAALGNAELTAAEFARATSILERSGARARVEAMIEERLAAAQAALEEVPARAFDLEARGFFAGLLDFLRERRR